MIYVNRGDPRTLVAAKLSSCTAIRRAKLFPTIAAFDEDRSQFSLASWSEA